MIQDKIEYIRERMTEPALFELLAEECAETAQAALKYARILRGENPTDADKLETVNNLYEEMRDIMTVLEVIENPGYDAYKIERWAHRLERAENARD